MRLIGVGETCTKTLTMTLQISMGLSPGSSKSALVGICKTASAKIQLLNTEKTRVEKYITFAYFSIRNVGIAKWSQPYIVKGIFLDVTFLTADLIVHSGLPY